MKSRIHLKLLMAPLSMLTLFACSPNQFQQASEYDDVYFTSADRQKAPKVITKPGSASGDLSQVITLENRSSKSVDKELVTKYTNSSPSEVEYFVDGEVNPKVEKANQLNYNDFVSDYENEMLATYALPLDWETEWDENYFNNLIYNDFEFRLAWYEQYYVGDNDRMDRYINATTGRIANSNFSDFNSSRVMANSFYPGAFRPRFGVSVGLGFGNGFNGSFNDPFYDPFFDPYYDPFFYGTSWRFSSRNRFNRRNGWGAWNRGFGGFGFGGFNNFNSYVYCPPIFSNQYIYRGEVLASRNDRTYSRGGRVQSSSVSSVRSDATNGIAPTRSQRLSSTSGTRSAVSRSAIASRTERNSGRVRSTSSSGVSSSRSSRSTSSTVPSVRSSRSSRTSTDAYRFDESSRSNRSSAVRANATSGRTVASSRTARSSTSSSRATTNRSSSNRSSSAPSYNRSSSRTSSGSVSRPSSSSSSRGVSRSSSNRSTSSRSSGVRSSGSSSRSTSGSVSKSRSSSGSAKSSSSSRSSSGSTKSSSSSKGSSRSGRGN